LLANFDKIQNLNKPFFKSDLNNQIQEFNKYESLLDDSNQLVDLNFYTRYKTMESTCVYLFKLIGRVKNPLPCLEKLKASGDRSAQQLQPSQSTSEPSTRVEILEAENRFLKEKSAASTEEIWSLKKGNSSYKLL
jgi:hypothetical protein